MMRLHHVVSKRTAWSTLLSPFGGVLPHGEQEVTQLITAVKNQARMIERTHAGPWTLEEGWARPAATSGYFADYEEESNGAWVEPSFFGMPGSSGSEWYAPQEEYYGSCAAAEFAERTRKHKRAQPGCAGRNRKERDEGREKMKTTGKEKRGARGQVRWRR